MACDLIASRLYTDKMRSILALLVVASAGAGVFEACSQTPNGSDGGSEAGSDAASDVVLADAAPGDAGTDGAASGLHIMAFFGNNTPAPDTAYGMVASSGVLTGPVIVVRWNTVDDGGTPDFTALDGPSSPLQAYLAQYPSEKVSILFEPASDIFSNVATPLDVLESAGQQICFCDQYGGDYPDSSPPVCAPNGKWNGTPDYTGLPVPFTGTFAARWQGFIAQAIAHLNAASYHASILYVTFGVSNGGEDIPRCSIAEEALVDGGMTGLSNAWIANVTAQDIAVQNAKPIFPVVAGTSCLGTAAPPTGSTTTDNCGTFADLEAQAHAAHGVGLRITTLQSADILAYDAGTPTVSDWARMNAMYPNVPIVWQTAGESAPVAPNNPKLCDPKTGPLAVLVPFIMTHSSPGTPLRALEAYYADLEGTYVSGFHDPCWPSGTVTTDPYGPYDTVFKAAVAGQ